MTSSGISFIVRIHNEEATLEQSIRSLFSFTCEHEIVLILHCCTDKSATIATSLASENPNIRVMTYDTPTSRAGYETLATDADSPHSFITYSNWCIQQAKFPWVFKWDADFIATPKLIEYMNNTIWEAKNIDISVIAKNSTSNNHESYIVGGPRVFVKCIFWENNLFNETIEHWHFPDYACIEHASELTNLKSYWNETPWFETESSDEARLVKSRIDRLTSDFGPEPRGLARASNPECDSIYDKITKASPNYVNFFS
jgi:glycosyltransferase involved in cell wall biosynthesis